MFRRSQVLATFDSKIAIFRLFWRPDIQIQLPKVMSAIFTFSCDPKDIKFVCLVAGRFSPCPLEPPIPLAKDSWSTASRASSLESVDNSSILLFHPLYYLESGHGEASTSHDLRSRFFFFVFMTCGTGPAQGHLATGWDGGPAPPWGPTMDSSFWNCSIFPGLFFCQIFPTNVWPKG